MIKRFFSGLLVICMVLGLMVTPAFAFVEDKIFILSEEEHQAQVDEIVRFVENHPTSQIVPISQGDLYCAKELTSSIVGDETDVVKQLKLIKAWFAKYPDQSPQTIETVKKLFAGTGFIFDWDCDDRAKVFQAMCRSLNIPCVCIRGAVSYDRHSAAGHMWNMVQIDDVWYMFDPSTFILSGPQLVFMRDCNDAVDLAGTSLYMWYVASHDEGSLDSPYWDVSDYAVDGVLEAYYKGLTYDYYFDQVDHKAPISRIDFAGCANNLICQIEDAKWADIWDHYSDQGADFDDTNDPEAKLANALGFVAGVGNNKFNPTGKITRQEAATMLMRIGQAYGLEPTSDPVAFSDVAADSWAKAGIDYVSALGIMSGIGGNKFDPNGLYTYEQTILTVLRLYNLVTE